MLSDSVKDSSMHLSKDEQTPYQYAFNSPLIWKDPSGLKGEKERGDRIMGMENCIKLSEGIYTISREIVCYAYRDIDINNFLPVNSALEKGLKFFDPNNNSINYVLKNGFSSGKDLLVGKDAITGTIKKLSEEKI